MEKTELDFIASKKVLKLSIENYKNGVKEAYRPASVELRKLLCDKKALLSRARPDLKLHKLHCTEVFENAPSLKDGLTMIMPGRLSIDSNGNSWFELTFSKEQALMTVEDWISQPFLNINITIRELIKSVADKEGAHSDLKYGDTLEFSKMIKYINDESHIPGIIAIGDYLCKWIEDSKSQILK